MHYLTVYQLFINFGICLVLIRIQNKMKIMKTISTKANKLINSEMFLAGSIFLLGVMVLVYELLF